jgi:FKBP-type peptidyl-prolyl cis-trans isomerase
MQEVSNTLDEMMKKRNELQQKQMEDFQKEFQLKAEKNKTENIKFLAENKLKPGVITTPSGLQYQIIQEGTGPIPSMNDSVRINYLGTFTDGKMFDDTRTRGAVPLNLKSVIIGMQEALSLIKAGTKCKLWIPPELAYGERGAGYTIPGNAILIYELELIEIINKK